MTDVFGALRDHGPKRRNRSSVSVGSFAVTRQPNYFSGGNIAHIQIVVLDVSDPFFVWGGFFILARHRLGTALAFISVQSTRPRCAVDRKGNGFRVVGELDGVEGKVGWRDFSFKGLRKRNGKFCMVKCGVRGALLGIDKKKCRGSCSDLAIPETVFLGDPVRSDVGNVDAMPQISRNKLLSALIVLARVLGRRAGYRKEQ